MAKADLLKKLEDLKVTPIKDATNEVLELQIKAAENEKENIKLKVESEKVNGLVEEIETLTASNQSLTEALEVAQQKKVVEERKSKFPTYLKGKETYQFKVLSFFYQGVKHLSVDAVKDKKLMESLIEIDFAHLKKL